MKIIHMPSIFYDLCDVKDLMIECSKSHQTPLRLTSVELIPEWFLDVDGTLNFYRGFLRSRHNIAILDDIIKGMTST